MRVAVLDYEHIIRSSVTGPIDILLKANETMEAFMPESAQTRFDIDVISTRGSNASNSGWIAMSHVQLGDIRSNKKYDLVIIPATDINYVQQILEKETDSILWIREQYSHGAEIASICLGAFMLAESGLLDNKFATTHWLGVDLFRKRFPNVNLLDDKIITDHNGLYTSGGAFSFTSLLIYLVEKYCGKEVAVLTSKVLMIHVHNIPQHAFAIFSLQRNHDDKDIIKVQDYIDDHLDEKITVELMATKAGLSTRTFIRRFNKATGNTPNEYLQRIRTEKAKQLLTETNSGAEQAGYQVGYEDVSAFRKVFKKITGMTPNEYRKRYNKMFQGSYIEVNL